MSAVPRSERVAAMQHSKDEQKQSVSSTPLEVPKAPVGMDVDNASNKKEKLRLLRIREAKWLQMLSQWEVWTHTQPDRIKNRCRKGIPDSLRGRAWLAIVGADRDARRLARPAWYSELLRAAAPVAAARVDVTAMGMLAFMPGYPAGSTRTDTDTTAGEQAQTRREADQPFYVTDDAVASIERDLNRTLPQLQLFATKPGVGSTEGDDGAGQAAHRPYAHSSDAKDAYVSATVGQASLFRVLLALSCSDPSVLYCQGMGFPTALFLSYVPEEDAFWALYILMQGKPEDDAAFWTVAAQEGCDVPPSCVAAVQTGATAVQLRQRGSTGIGATHVVAPKTPTPGSASVSPTSANGSTGCRATELRLRGLYESGLPLLQRMQHILTGLVHYRMPKLGACLDSLGIHPSMYAAQWAMTLFMYQWPYHTVVRCFDVILWEGWKGWIRIALASMIIAEKDLLAAQVGKYYPLVGYGEGESVQSAPAGRTVSTIGVSGFEGVMAVFKDFPHKVVQNPDRLLNTATQDILRFSRTELLAVSEEYDKYVSSGHETCGADAGACLRDSKGKASR